MQISFETVTKAGLFKSLKGHHITSKRMCLISVRPYIDIRFVHWIAAIAWHFQDRLISSIPKAKVLEALGTEDSGQAEN